MSPFGNVYQQMKVQVTIHLRAAWSVIYPFYAAIIFLYQLCFYAIGHSQWFSFREWLGRRNIKPLSPYKRLEMLKTVAILLIVLLLMDNKGNMDISNIKPYSTK